MRTFQIPLWLSIAMVLGGACGGGSTASPPPPASATPTVSGSPTVTTAPTCSPGGTALEISASNTSFDGECLAGPANTAFTIEFANQDAGISHNVAIFDHPGGTSIFVGRIIQGPKTITYRVKRLRPGTYYFRCNLHPLRMNGDLVVG